MRNKHAIKMIESYQANKNPYAPPKCRFYPSCSNYALECYKKFNFVKASLLVSSRLLRCNPFTKGGYDPVPLTRAEKLARDAELYRIEIENPEAKK